MKKHIPTEKSIVQSILYYLNNLPKCRAIKFQGTIRKHGEPDIFCCYHGRMILLEVKRPDGEPTPLQEVTLQLWRNAGAVAEVVSSVNDVKKILDDLKRLSLYWRD